MAQVKITQLTAYADPKSTDVLAAVDVSSDVTKKVDIAAINKNAAVGSATAVGMGFDGDPNTGLYSVGSDQIAIATGGVGRLFIDTTGDITIPGNLIVTGTTTTVDSQTLVVKDKNIEMGAVSSPTDVTADGGGITLRGTTNKTINWIDATDAWTSSEHISIASGKEYRINGTKVIDATSLGSALLTNSTSSTSTTTAATPASVKTAYDAATAAQTTANAALPKAGGTVTGNLEIGNTGSLTFEGATADAFETTLAVVDPTADRTITLPNVTGTVVTSGDTGSVTSTMILDGTILDADINASAAIAGTKISPNFGSQNLTSTGTSTAASFIPTSSTIPTNGVYLPAANNVAISTNGAGRVFVDSSGKVGIGQSAPVDSLHVVGAARIGSTNFIGIGADGSGSYLESAVGTHVLRFNTNGSERLRITSDGRLGLGVSSPSSRLVSRDTNESGIVTALAVENYITGNPFSGNGVAFDFNLNNNGNTTANRGRIAIVNTNYHAESEMRFYTAASNAIQQRMVLDASGRLGIGTSSPSQTLTVVAPSNAQAIGIWNRALDNTYGAINFKTNDGATDQSIIQNSRIGTNGAQLSFYTKPDGGSAAEKLTIDSTGRVGIGTTSPGSALDVNGAITARGDGSQVALYLGAGSQSIRDLGTASITYLDLATGSTSHGQFIVRSSNAYTERARIDSSGRLLVGTSTARSNLYGGSYNPLVQIETSGALTDRTLNLAYNNAGSNAGGAILSFTTSRGSTAGSNTLVANNDELGSLNFAGADGTKPIIGASVVAYVDGTPGANDMPGRLVFSTTADGAASPTARMTINPDGTIYYGVLTASVTPGGIVAYPGTAGQFAIGHASGTASGTAYAGFQLAGTQIGSITQNGTTAVAYNTSSDYRLKENVTAVPDGIARLQQLKPSRFNFIADPDRVVDGFIAHEAQAVVPECVTGEKDAVDDDGNPVYQGIDQSKLVPLLTAALQEAIGRIETLEAEVAALKSA